MKNVILIGLGAWICFIIQYFFSELFSPWFRPNLLLLLVIFFNLYRGIRYSLLVAFFAGLISDSFTPDFFGINIFIFMMSAYLTTFLKMYIYESGSSASRFFLIFFITSCFGLMEFLVRMVLFSVDFGEAFRYQLLPQTFATAVVALYVMKRLRQCALRLFA
ncbi:MAG: rod shape-determining protein MreD [Candidatus Omnitrophota bacterium]